AVVVYLNTEMGAHIQPAGWREWHPGETQRLETVFYAEEGSTGPGARLNERDPHAHRLSSTDAENYLPVNFLRGGDGWNPAAQIQ
ncbi:MAG: pectinesterase family protein, partial [Terracidiphilus sp.]